MSPQYLLPCSCGRKLPVDLTQAGNRIRCECGADLEVPTLLHLRRLDQAPLPSQVAEVPATTWGARQRLALAGGVLSIAGVVLAAWCFVTRPRFVDVAEYPPMATLRLWESLKGGVDVPPSILEMALFATQDWHHRWTVVGLVVAVLGVVMIGGSWLVRRPSLAKQPPVS